MYVLRMCVCVCVCSACVCVYVLMGESWMGVGVYRCEYERE